MPTQIFHYIKIYTIKINRIAIENYRWYYSKKGETFKCVMVVKETNERRLSPSFLVIDNNDGELLPPTSYRTIRPLECEIVHEEIIDNQFIYNFTENYNASEVVRMKRYGDGDLEAFKKAV